MRKTYKAAVTSVLLLACQAADEPAEMESAPSRAADSPRSVTDSVFPVEEEIRRFKAARQGASTSELTGASASRDALVGRFIKALESSDTADIRRMALNAAEFIDLYYPSSMFSRPPYKQSPEVRWFLIQQNSNKGITRLLSRYGGQKVTVLDYNCAPEPTVEGENKLWDRCTVNWNLQPSPMRIFSTIIERNGRFKFVSYANDF
jgi:hypothetical protein